MTSSRWSARTKRTVTLVVLVLIGFGLWNLRQVIPLLIVATLLSFLLWPLVNIIEKRIAFVMPFGGRSLAVFAAFIMVLAIFAVAFIVIVPVLFAQVAEVGRDIPEIIADAEVQLEEFLNQPITINGRPVLFNGEPIIPLKSLADFFGTDPESVSLTSDTINMSELATTFFQSIGGLTGSAFSVVGGAFDVVVNLVFLITIVFYMTRDGTHFVDVLVKATPEPYRGDMSRMLYELGRVWNAYFRGQLILSVSIGVAVYIVSLAIGLPNAPILGLISGMFEFIPNLGPFIALVPAALTALASESSTIPFLAGIPFALAVIFIWILIQNIEAALLVPRVMGGSLNLHPVVVIIAVISGASIAGAMGVVLAAPFAATGRLFGQYIYGKLFDTSPFPPIREVSPPPDISRLSWRQLIPFWRFFRRRSAHAVNKNVASSSMQGQEPGSRI